MASKAVALELMEDYVEILKPAYPDIQLDRDQVCVRYTLEGQLVEEGYAEVVAAFYDMAFDYDYDMDTDDDADYEDDE